MPLNIVFSRPPKIGLDYNPITKSTITAVKNQGKEGQGPFHTNSRIKLLLPS